ncbi:MAG: EamA family transporter [Dehalococcoidia bacterium]
MSYIAWAIIAMVAYGIMITLLKFSLRSIPPEAALFVTNTILVILAFLWAIYRGVKIPEHLALNQPTLLLLLAGVVLSVSIISFYMALSRGPASTVAPLFGMNIAVVSVLGFLVLKEPVNPERVIGILMAGGAIFLLTR